MILVLGGTKDSREIIEIILSMNKEVIATTTTKYGSELLINNKNLIKVNRKLNQNEMLELIKKYEISKVIDATHPYAKNVSENIMKVVKKMNILYLRYEREKSQHSFYKEYDSYDEIVEFLSKENGNVLLTIGSNNLEKFDKLNSDRLFARILPTSNVIKKCEKIGIKPKNIIALQGPFTIEFNELIIKEKNIKFLVTKESGKVGGFYEKVQSCKNLKIECLVLKRPNIEYMNITSDYDDIRKFVNRD